KCREMWFFRTFGEARFARLDLAQLKINISTTMARARQLTFMERPSVENEFPGHLRRAFARPLRTRNRKNHNYSRDVAAGSQNHDRDGLLPPVRSVLRTRSQSL